jgi:hypothetical protein
MLWYRSSARREAKRKGACTCQLSRQPHALKEHLVVGDWFDAGFCIAGYTEQQERVLSLSSTLGRENGFDSRNCDGTAHIGSIHNVRGVLGGSSKKSVKS